MTNSLLRRLFMKEINNEVPIWEKYTLNVKEAASYFGIGEKTIRRLIAEHRGEAFVLEVGTHTRIKRKQFEKFLDDATCI